MQQQVPFPASRIAKCIACHCNVTLGNAHFPEGIPLREAVKKPHCAQHAPRRSIGYQQIQPLNRRSVLDIPVSRHLHDVRSGRSHSFRRRPMAKPSRMTAAANPPAPAMAPQPDPKPDIAPAVTTVSAPPIPREATPVVQAPKKPDAAEIRRRRILAERKARQEQEDLETAAAILAADRREGKYSQMERRARPTV